MWYIVGIASLILLIYLSKKGSCLECGGKIIDMKLTGKDHVVLKCAKGHIEVIDKRKRRWGR